VRIASEDFPFGAWCIAVRGSDANMVVLTVSLLNDPEPSTEEPEIPAVQWNLQAPDCPDGQLQVETLVYVNGLPQHEARPFSFTGEVIG
jgi:hypothetical protein